MMKRRAADEFFRRKIPGSEKHEGARHTAYRIRDQSGRVLLGNLTMSRCAPGEDLSLRNMKGLAEDLGMSLEGLIEASSCRIRATIVAICVAARVLETAHEMHELDPIAYDDHLARTLSKALLGWLEGIDIEPSKLSNREVKELNRSLSRLREGLRDELFAPMSEHLSRFVEGRLKLA